MDVYDLLERLRYENVLPNTTSIGEPFREGTYCLEKTHGEWRVFSIERGERIAETVFDDESPACQKFLTMVLRDSTTRPFDSDTSIDA